MTHPCPRTTTLTAALLASLAGGAGVQAQPADESTALTIYSTAAPGAVPPELYRPVLSPESVYGVNYWQQIPGYAVVKHERLIPLPESRSTVRFTDVAALIDPTTVTFTSLTDPDSTQVVEQNYQFDLVNTGKLLERYLDHEITVEVVKGDSVERITGTLLSAGGGTGSLILRESDQRVRVVNGYSTIVFPALPEGLMTKPTLVWDIYTEQEGDHRARVSYQTAGITWWADYNLVFAEGETANSGTLDVGAWVSILNQSGATYPEAKLKLIAGDVHRAPLQPMYRRGREMDMMAAEASAPRGFEEKSFFEYHLYTLGRPTTLPDRSTKQIELFDAAAGVPADKVMVYYGLPDASHWIFPEPATDRQLGTQSNQKVDIYLRFQNDQAHGLGIPLPSGRIRVSQLDAADGTLEFIGEDTIDHTPKDEEVLIKLGSAFDVVGERTQTDFSADYNARRMEETIEIKVRNHKAQPVEVLVKENLYRWVNWQITQKTHEFEKVDARTVHFPVTIPPDGEAVVRYTVRYTW